MRVLNRAALCLKRKKRYTPPHQSNYAFRDVGMLSTFQQVYNLVHCELCWKFKQLLLVYFELTSLTRIQFTMSMFTVNVMNKSYAGFRLGCCDRVDGHKIARHCELSLFYHIISAYLFKLFYYRQFNVNFREICLSASESC